MTGLSGVRWAPVGLSVIALVGAVALAITIGAVPIPFPELTGALWRGALGESNSVADTIVWQIRLPRVIMAASVGAALALAGVGFQGIFQNPLADPYLLGAASGAGLGATLVIAFGSSVPWLAVLGVPFGAFIAACLTVALVVFLARRGGRIPPVSLILAGVVIGSSLSAATSFVLLASREQTAGILSWLLGSFAFSSWSRLGGAAPLLIIAAVVLLLAARALNIIQLGEDAAAQLGLPVERVKLVVIGAATLATAAAVAVSGVIGFVGLITPHAVRLAIGPDHRSLAPLSALWGALFLVLADLLARTVLAPAEIPVGIVTALAGGPFFLYLLRKNTA